MGLIDIELFATLDLVGQAPGSPDEDPLGFPFGGWQAPLLDEVAGAQGGPVVGGPARVMREIPQVHGPERHPPQPGRPPQHAFFQKPAQHARKNRQHIDLHGAAHTG